VIEMTRSAGVAFLRAAVQERDEIQNDMDALTSRIAPYQAALWALEERQRKLKELIYRLEQSEIVK